MDSFLEQELRGLIAGCQIQIKILRNDLEVAQGASLATNVALHGLIAAFPDLELAGRALAAVRRDFEGGADPATAELAAAFDHTFSGLQQTVENRKDIARRQAPLSN